jgi:phage tail sheath protein FI
LLDCPPFVNNISAAVDWITTGLTVSDPNGAAFFPRLRLPDALNNYQLRTFAPSGVVAGLFAKITPRAASGRRPPASRQLFPEFGAQGQTPTPAYFVKCDSETTTQTDIDNGVVNIVVGFAPLEPAEFVVIQIQQLAGQTSS